MAEKKSIESDAVKAIRYNTVITNRQKAIRGVNKLANKPSSFGMALKWLIYIKGMTYEQFAKRYNGTTRQNLNYLINRVPKENVIYDDLEKMLAVINVDFDYFMQLADCIEKKMGNK